MTRSDEIRKLEFLSTKCRLNVVRMIRAGGGGHLGGALSSIDIITALYFHIMDIDPNNPNKPDRDRFVLSAGHKCLALYSVLCERGFFDDSILDTFGMLRSRIPGHPDMKKLPGIEANTGALGHGLSISLGMALGLREKYPRSQVFTILGDGELTEGSNWEASAAASHYKVDSLTAIIDDNDLQISGNTADVMKMKPITEHFAAFGWATKEINGNNMLEIVNSLNSLPIQPGKPNLIVAHTIKSKGISFAENKPEYHYWSPKSEELEQAEMEIIQELKRLE